MGRCNFQREEFAEALDFHKDAYECRRIVLGDNHWDAAATLFNIAQTHNVATHSLTQPIHPSTHASRLETILQHLRIWILYWDDRVSIVVLKKPSALLRSLPGDCWQLALATSIKGCVCYDQSFRRGFKPSQPSASPRIDSAGVAWVEPSNSLLQWQTQGKSSSQSRH